jgi:hypothetical protein
MVLFNKLNDLNILQVSDLVNNGATIFTVISLYTGCNRNTRNNFNHELLYSCRTRKKYLKNSMSKNKLTFNF